MTRKSKIIVTIALMLGISLASLDTTIVGTAMPTIVGKLGGITLYSWVFSAYLLASTTTVPIYGKLADLFGRKPIFLFGTTVFLIGSAASGAAQSMEQLILFRAIQGLGAGAVLPIVLTIIGDIFALEERAKVQGLFSGVWGLSSIIGPALGGVIVDHFSWRWVFYITLPFGLLSAFLLIVSLKENVERKKHSIDYLGSLTLTVGIGALLFALLQGGVTWAWTSLPSLGLFALAIVLLVLFLFQEARASEPILPLTLFTNRIITISSIGGVILGVVMFGITSYVPLFVSAVRVATASTQFFRTIGGTVGVAVMGTILNLQMAARFAPILARYPAVVAHLPKNMAPSNVLLSPDVRQSLPVDFLHQLQTALAQSLFWVYVLMFALAVLGLATMFLFPGGRADKYSYKSTQAASNDTPGESREVEAEHSLTNTLS